MEKITVSFLTEDSGLVKSLKLDLVNVEANRYQPTVTVSGSNGFESVTRLPVSDYGDLKRRLEGLVSMDADGLRVLLGKVNFFLSMMPRGSNGHER